MGCTFKARLNSLWSIWYTILVVAVQSYLLYLGFQRYKLYNEMKWPTGGYPQIWLNVYVILYAVCIPLSLLFFAFGFFKSGNIPGDNEKLADREERIIEIDRNRKGEKTGCLHALKVLWQHCPPLPQQIHVIMALCQVMAGQLMISQLYRHGIIPSADFLNTELDFLYQRAKQLVVNLPMGDSRVQGFRITTEELSGLPLAPNLLPLLMHFRLFGIPLEFVNLFVALVAYSCAFPAVFWRVSKPYSLLFSLHLFIYSVAVIWGYLGFSILFRIQETNYNSIRPIGLGQYLTNFRWLPFYNPYYILGTFVAYLGLITIVPTTLYAHGYNKYYISQMNLKAKNNVRSSTGGQSEYSEYRRRSYGRSPSHDLCWSGYCPHANAICLLVLIVMSKMPIIYALMIMYQHEEKPILLTCIIVDVVYVFTWILLWLILTLKKEWKFNVAHKAHQLYALQKGMAAGHISGNENPSQMKNALVVMHRDHMFVTDDSAAKQSLLRHIQRGQHDLNDTSWIRAAAAQGSPTGRKIRMDESVKNTPEMSRMLRRPSEDGSQIVYHSVTRNSGLPPNPINMRGNSSPPDDRQVSFGTLQRAPQQQQQPYGSTLQRSQMSTLQRSLPPGQWPTQQEAYASIHKAKDNSLFNRRGSNENSHYGQLDNNTYSNYATYARLPQQQNVPVGTMRINGNNYGIQQGTLQRQQLADQQALNGVRQSPLLSDRGSTAGLNNPNNSQANREPSAYQRSAVKMTSFNNEKPIYGSVPTQWGTQRAPPGQPSQLLWNQNNKPTISASSSQQDAQCFTPTSTLTSQHSASNYSSQNTPTAGSPQATTPLYVKSNGELYGTVGGGASAAVDDTYGDRTLQKPKPAIVTGSTTVRHTVKIVGTTSNGGGGGRTDDSANFSLTSSNASSDTPRANEFATSIV